MLTELCQELRNWFDKGQKKISGEFIIVNRSIYQKSGAIIKPLSELGLLDEQYYRIIGSALNDGVYQYGNTEEPLREETFSGVVWFMAVPPAVVSLDNEITAWIAKYGDEVNSPFNSESFGGYSYSKGTATSGATGGGGVTWQSIFKSRLNKWRKL